MKQTKLEVVPHNKKDKKTAKLMEKLLEYQFDTYQRDWSKLEMETQEVYYQHTYISGSFVVDGHRPKRAHACLYTGDWCWSNAVQDPIMAIKFIYRKLI